uniref:Endonuclease 8 n=1 Tax=Lygus hesperus TaxID=30085 RepID=A0A0A9Y4K7_LYGHE
MRRISSVVGCQVVTLGTSTSRCQSMFAGGINTAPAQSTTSETSSTTDTVNPMSTTMGTPRPQPGIGANRVFAPPRMLPRFEIFDVRDSPSQGTMTRVAVDGRQLLISQYPQLGPRKVDPNDFSPQFDSERRITVRFRHKDLAGLVAVM